MTHMHYLRKMELLSKCHLITVLRKEQDLSSCQDNSPRRIPLIELGIPFSRELDDVCVLCNKKNIVLLVIRLICLLKAYLAIIVCFVICGSQCSLTCALLYDIYV